MRFREMGIETSEASVRRAVTRHGILRDHYRARNARQELMERTEAAGIKYHDNGSVEVTLAPTSEEPRDKIAHLSIEEVMERHQLDPEEWEADKVLPNVWEANAGRDPETLEPVKIQLYQFKVWFKKRVPLSLVFPATVGPKIKPPKAPDRSQSLLTVVVTDQQAPFRLEGLHQLFLRWLRHNKADQGIIGGDLLDFGYISRHRDDPAWDTTVQECLQCGFDTLWDYRNAYEDCSWTLVNGNHDQRLRNEMLERAERLYGITPAQYPGDEPEEWVYSFNHLLHLKRLGITYDEPLGTYEFEEIPITDKIAVRHGHKTVKDGAIKTADELGISLVAGHSHRQSITRKTRWNSILGDWEVLTAVEAGCMCEIEGGLGYASAGVPNWQPGFATVTSFPDGGFTCELATYEQSGILRWRDQEFSL